MENLDKTVFVGVVAVDEVGNKGDLSNIIEVYVKDPNPTTTEVTATTPESGM